MTIKRLTRVAIIVKLDTSILLKIQNNFTFTEEDATLANQYRNIEMINGFTRSEDFIVL